MKGRKGRKGDGEPHVRLAVYLRGDSYKQIEDLMEALNVQSCSAIISQAVARWHHSEKLVHALHERREKEPPTPAPPPAAPPPPPDPEEAG